MKKTIYFAAVLFAVVLVVGISAMNTENKMVCTVTGTMLTGNHLDNQIPHFMCCDSIGYCKMGNTLYKHLRLTNMNNETGNSMMLVHSEADIRVNSYNGLDNVAVTLRSTKLPMNQVFSAWLVDSSTGDKLNLGLFKTNRMGTGYLYSKQSVMDFNNYDMIVVMNPTIAVLGGNLNFTTSTH